MKVDVALLLKLRKDKAWSQDEPATASGLNLRTIQRIDDSVKGTIVEIGKEWLKLMEGKKPVYIHLTHIKRIIPK